MHKHLLWLMPLAICIALIGWCIAYPLENDPTMYREFSAFLFFIMSAVMGFFVFLEGNLNDDDEDINDWTKRNY